MGKNYYIIPIFIPHKGCPFDCVFCNQKKITGLETELTGDLIAGQIKDYYDTIPDKEKVQIEIAFFGGSFTGIDIEMQKELLSKAYEWKSKGLVKDIRLSTRPDYISHEILEVLIKYGVTIVELGVQSMDEEVLLQSGRGHTAEDVINASKLIREYGIQLGLQMMLGLPGDSKDKALMTGEKLIKINPDFVRIYPTLIIKDTHLEQLYLTGRYTPLSLSEAVDISKDLLKKFIKNKMPVIRIGLQPTEELVLKGSVIAGPFHPSFRQLVESEIIKDSLKYLFSKNNIKNINTTLNIEIKNQLVSNLVGQKKTNIIFLKTHFNIKNIKIIPNNRVPNNSAIINFNDKEIVYDLYKYIENTAF